MLSSVGITIFASGFIFKVKEANAVPFVGMNIKKNISLRLKVEN